MPKNLTATIVALFLSTLGSGTLWADPDSDVQQKLAALPSAPLVVTMDQAAGSPSVILTDKGAFINHAKEPVAFDKVLAALADLPKTAWHFGRIVVISPPAPGDNPAPKDVADKVELTLETANIRLLHASQ